MAKKLTFSKPLPKTQPKAAGAVIQCPQCQQKLRIPAEASQAKAARCPKCSKEIPAAEILVLLLGPQAAPPVFMEDTLEDEDDAADDDDPDDDDDDY